MRRLESDVADMRRDGGDVGLICASHRWTTPRHPDLDGVRLRELQDRLHAGRQDRPLIRRMALEHFGRRTLTPCTKAVPAMHRYFDVSFGLLDPDGFLPCRPYSNNGYG